jgi:hypothetical protein
MVVGLLLPGRAQAGIAVEAPDCPGRAQVVAALESRLPGATAGPPDRRLDLRPSAPGIALRLLDGTGALVLERELKLDQRTAASSTHAEACQTLAEAAALVVVRYLREIGYRPPSAGVVERAPEPPAVTTEAPPPRAPSPPWPSAGFLGLAGAGRVGTGGSSVSPRGEMMVGLAAHFGPLAAELAGGASSESQIPVPDSGSGELRLRAFPLRAALGVPFPAPGGFLVPAAGMSVDVLSFRARGLAGARSGVRLDPAVELGASYVVVRRRLYARALLSTGLTLAPRDFALDPDPAGGARAQPVFRTADAYFRALLEVGVVLWKNGSQGSL